MDSTELHRMTTGGGHGRGNHEVSIVSLAGGVFLPLASYPALVHAEACVVADVPQELGRVRPVGLSLIVPLARGETTTTLLEKAVAGNPTLGTVQARLRSLPAIDLHQGLGMLRSLGLAAAQVASRDHAVSRRLREELLVSLLRRKNGGIHHAEIRYYNALAGATGGPTARLLAELGTESVLQRTNATVTLTGVQVGAVTFLGLGNDERIFQNGAVSLLEQIAFTLDPSRSAREARTLILTELPTIDASGHELDADSDTRSHLALTLVGGLYAHTVQIQLLRGRPNRTLAHPCGALTLVRAAWYGVLRPQVITATAAMHYATELTAIVHQESQPSRTTDAAVRVVLSPLPASPPPPTTEDIIAEIRQSNGGKPANIDTKIWAAREMRGEVWVQSVGTEMALEPFLNRLIDIASVDHLVQAYGYVHELVRLLERNALEARAQETKAHREVRRLQRDLRQATDGLFQTRWFDGATAAFRWFRRPLKRFRYAHQNYQSAQQEYVDAHTWLNALDAGLKRVRRTVGILEELHRRLIRTLESLAEGQHDLSCTFQPLRTVFGDLLRFINERDSGQLRAFLATTARAMSLESLAALVTAEPTIESVASRILATPQYDGPFWGGEDPCRAPFLKFIVVPPIDAALREQLHDAITQHGLAYSVVSMDTLAGGASVLSLEFFAVEDVGELFPPAYRLGLREALTSERDLYPVSTRARTLAASLLEDLDSAQGDEAQTGRNNP